MRCFSLKRSDVKVDLTINSERYGQLTTDNYKMFFRNLHTNKNLLTCTLVWVFLFAFFVKSNAQTDMQYQGYRLQVYNIEVMKEGRDFYQIRCNLANTGRENLDIKPTRPQPQLILNYDHTIFENKLGSYRENIRRSLTTADLKLKTGKVKDCFFLRFPKMLPEDTVRNPNPPAMITEAGVNKDKDAEQEVDTKQAESAEENITRETEKSAQPVAVFTPEDASCYDFSIDTVKVLKYGKKSVLLEYTLKNNGNAGAPMLGKTDAENDNLAIRAFISGVPKMTKGALVFGGTFVENQEKGADGKIPPGMRYKATFELDIRDKSRYMNYLILSLDPFNTVEECDERNNVHVVDLTGW